MSVDKDPLEIVVTGAIDEEAARLNIISQKIWKDPELKFDEHKAHELLTTELSKYGFKVQPSYRLPTAFKAEYGNEEDGGPVACVICEYDALPDIGHACGHNLIAETGIGAAIGIKAAIEKGLVKGKVVCLGTPAEEGGGGKAIMIDRHAFDGIDFSLMAHPAQQDDSNPLIIAIKSIKVEFKGKSSHASLCPWEGVNALDAVVAAYVNMSLLRQQMRPTWRIHAVIDKGGDVPNVIPSLTEMTYMIRAPNVDELTTLDKKARACLSAAAEATGCEFTTSLVTSYDSMLTNKAMAELYEKYAYKIGDIVCFEGNRISGGSTDMGNVSQILPSIHPMYFMGTEAGNHTKEFTEASGKPEAQVHTLNVTKALAMTAVAIMKDPELMQTIKEEFRQAKKKK